MPHETRRLLIAATIALLAIGALARVRFADQSVPPNPVAPLLSQLTPRARFEDLASQLADLQPRIQTLLAPLPPLTALRVAPDAALAWSPPDRPAPISSGDVLARDRASGLLVTRTGATATGNQPVLPLPWSPDRLDQPRYVIAARMESFGVRLAPVLIPALRAVSNPLWPGEIWAVAEPANLRTGSFVFTEDGQLVGMTWQDEGAQAIVPAGTLMIEMQRLLAGGNPAPGWLGIDVSGLTPSLSRATGASSGVVVSWIDPRSPASGSLAVGDVVEGIDGVAIGSIVEWRGRMRRLSAGQTVVLQIQRDGIARKTPLVAVGEQPRARRALGLELRRVGEGSYVARVETGSAAEDAGLRLGDVIVHAGNVAAPAPDQVRRLFGAATDARPLLTVINRDGAHHAMTLENDAPASR